MAPRMWIQNSFWYIAGRKIVVNHAGILTTKCSAGFEEMVLLAMSNQFFEIQLAILRRPSFSCVVPKRCHDATKNRKLPWTYAGNNPRRVRRLHAALAETFPSMNKVIPESRTQTLKWRAARLEKKQLSTMAVSHIQQWWNCFLSGMQQCYGYLVSNIQ